MWKIRKKRYILLFVTTFLALLAIYAFSIEPNLFVVSRHRLNAENATNQNSLQIVQISDLHLKKFNHRTQQIIENVNQLHPDIIVLTGDSIDRANQINEYDRFLSLLDRKIAKYAILGNWEYNSNVDLATLTKIYNNYNCRLLVNESTLYQKGNQSLLITGVDDLVGEPNLAKSLQNIKPHPNHLLLSHSPLYIDEVFTNELKILAEYKPQYMFSGHTHGGQISLFGFAPLLPPRSGNYVSGWYQTNSIDVYVSKGLGISVLPLRFGTVPEISYFEWFLK